VVLYLEASWAARLAASDSSGWAARAAELRREADGTARTLRWTPRWPDSPGGEEQAPPKERGARAAAKLRGLGVRGGRFEEHLRDTAAKLAVDSAGEFEDGLLRLGELLGFEAERPNGQADPDGAWRDGIVHWILFEAKTEERPDTPLSPSTVRQASTHERWVQSELEWETPEQVVTTIVTHKTQIDSGAPPIAGDVRMVAPSVIRAAAARTFEAFREVRAAARGLSDDELASRIAAAFVARALDTAALATELGPRRVADA
jgi:hypothetical protein